MANTYGPLATVTVGSGGAANIEFTNIPGTYTDLVIKLSSRTDRVATNADCFIKFNNSTSNRTIKKLYSVPSGTVGSSSSPVGGIGTSNGSSNTTNVFASTEIYIPNYTSSNNKTYSLESVQEHNDSTTTNVYATFINGLWSDTSAITSITLYIEESKNWVQYTTATLYGILKS